MLQRTLCSLLGAIIFKRASKALQLLEHVCLKGMEIKSKLQGRQVLAGMETGYLVCRC